MHIRTAGQDTGHPRRTHLGRQRLLALLLTIALTVSASACRPRENGGTTPTAPTTETDMETPTTPSESDSTAATAPASDTEAPVPVESDTKAESETETEIEVETDAAEPTAIRNVIFLIADGGGYDNFELARQVKEALFKNDMTRFGDTARTSLSGGRLAAYGYDNGTGLYLDPFLVGSVNTLLEIPHGTDPARQFITDSSAAGTALATGYKTAYCYAGIDADRHPRASLTELAQMNGMSTGIVSTKSFVDATPLAFFTSHSIHRYEYQDTSLQALLSGVDVVLVEGTEYGDIPAGGGASSHLGATDAGYTVVRTYAEMQVAARRGDDLVWGAFPGRIPDTLSYADGDRAADYISYDVDPAERGEPTLRAMTAAALDMLAKKDNPNGFFLMVEAGALDNAAEGGKLKYAVGEALAFDETFALCVEWAKEHGDNTLIVATADHDSGGFYGIERRKARLLGALLSDQFPDGTPITVRHTFEDYKQFLNMGETAGIIGGHSDMPVPLWLYAPAETRTDILTGLGIPLDTTPDKVRFADKGQYYDPAAVRPDYTIDNTAIAPVLAGQMGKTTLDDATAALYVSVATRHADGFTTLHNGVEGGTLSFGTPDTRTVGGVTVTYYPVTFTCGEYTFTRNSLTYDRGGEAIFFDKVGRYSPMALFITTEQAGRVGVTEGTFYLPREAVEMLTASD